MQNEVEYMIQVTRKFFSIACLLRPLTWSVRRMTGMPVCPPSMRRIKKNTKALKGGLTTSDGARSDSEEFISVKLVEYDNLRT